MTFSVISLFAIGLCCAELFACGLFIGFVGGLNWVAYLNLVEAAKKQLAAENLEKLIPKLSKIEGYLNSLNFKGETLHGDLVVAKCETRACLEDEP